MDIKEGDTMKDEFEKWFDSDGDIEDTYQVMAKNNVFLGVSAVLAAWQESDKQATARERARIVGMLKEWIRHQDIMSDLGY
jgi:hypothetical protein